MLFYLPDHHPKSVRYYGFYAASYRKTRVDKNSEACSWSAGIQNSFSIKPKYCPDCDTLMQSTIYYSYFSFRLSVQLLQKFRLHEDGDYRPVIQSEVINSLPIRGP